MSRRLRRKNLNLMLSAAVLLSSMTPPIVRHSHTDGDRDHDHHSVEGVSHSHSHAHSHNHLTETTAKSSGEATHLHLTLFGFEFHLPEGDGGRAPFENDTDGPILIHWLDRDICVSAAADIDFISHSLLLTAAIRCEGAEVPRGRETAQTTRSSLPLCDAARCERSGVQQI